MTIQIVDKDSIKHPQFVLRSQRVPPGRHAKNISRATRGGAVAGALAGAAGGATLGGSVYRATNAHVAGGAGIGAAVGGTALGLAARHQAKKRTHELVLDVAKQYQSRLGNGSSIGRRIVDVDKAFGNGSQLLQVKGKGGKGMKPTSTGHGRKQMDQSPVHVGRRRNNGRTTALHVVKKDDDVAKGFIPTSFLAGAKTLAAGVGDTMKGEKTLTPVTNTGKKLYGAGQAIGKNPDKGFIPTSFLAGAKTLAAGVGDATKGEKTLSPVTNTGKKLYGAGQAIGKNPGKTLAVVGGAGAVGGIATNNMSKADDRVYSAELNRHRRMDAGIGATGVAGGALIGTGTGASIKHHYAVEQSRGALMGKSPKAIHLSPRAAGATLAGGALVRATIGLSRRANSRKHQAWT